MSSDVEAAAFPIAPSLVLLLLLKLSSIIYVLKKRYEGKTCQIYYY